MAMMIPDKGGVVSKPAAPKPPTQITSPSAPPPGYSTGPSATPGTWNQTPVYTQQTQYPTDPYDSPSPGGPSPGVPAVNPATDYLTESGYLASISALDEALRAFDEQDTGARDRYDLDFKKGLGDLGYKDENIDDDIPGMWDWNDMLTASGRGYQTNTNDFASRGMLQSQGYLDSLRMLERSLEDQRGAMGTARQGFTAEQDAAKTNYKNQDTAARATAMADAISRLNSGLGLI
jgi:hypothetical protein